MGDVRRPIPWTSRGNSVWRAQGEVAGRTPATRSTRRNTKLVHAQTRAIDARSFVVLSGAAHDEISLFSISSRDFFDPGLPRFGDLAFFFGGWRAGSSAAVACFAQFATRRGAVPIIAAIRESWSGRRSSRVRPETTAHGYKPHTLATSVWVRRRIVASSRSATIGASVPSKSNAITTRERTAATSSNASGSSACFTYLRQRASLAVPSADRGAAIPPRRPASARPIGRR